MRVPYSRVPALCTCIVAWNCSHGPDGLESVARPPSLSDHSVEVQNGADTLCLSWNADQMICRFSVSRCLNVLEIKGKFTPQCLQELFSTSVDRGSFECQF